MTEREFRLLRALTNYVRDLHAEIHTIREEQQSEKRECDANPIRPVLVQFDADTNIPPAIRKYYEAENSYRNSLWPRIKTVVEVIGITGAVSVAVFTGCTLREIQKQTITAEVSQRAQVTLGRQDGTIATFISSDKSKTADSIEIYFYNAGHLPAKFGWGYIDHALTMWPKANVSTKLRYNTGSFHPFLRFQDSLDRKIIEWPPDINLIQGGSQYNSDLVQLGREVIDNLFVEHDGNDPPGFGFTGAFNYCDGFGSYICKRFVIRYRGFPINQFRQVEETDCPADLIAIPPDTPARRSLPRCQ